MKKLFEKWKNLDENNKIVVKHTLSAFLIKGIALIVSFLTTPAFIAYFNDDIVLGVWYTLLSVLFWFLNFDLGIGNGVRNNLVNDLSANDRASAKKTISSGVFANLAVTLLLAVVGIIAVYTIDLNWLYNVEDNVISSQNLLYSTLFVLAAVLVRFFLTTINSIFYALQKSSVVNFLTLCVSVLQLIFVLIFRFESTDDALFWLSFSYIFLSNLPVVIAAIWVFATSMKDCIPSLKHVDKPHVKAVMGIGTVFFICQILYMLIINTNDFLITNLFGPQYTSEYNFYYKLTGLISMVVTLALTPVWSVVTKAQAEGNYKWLKKLYNIIKIVGLAVIVLEFAFVPFLQWIFDIWLGQGKVVVDYMTALAFACFGSVFVYSSMLSTIVCGMAKMKVQTVCYVVGTIVKFTALYLLAPIVQSWTLVVWMNVLVLLPYCIAEHIHLDIRINKLCKMEE